MIISPYVDNVCQAAIAADEYDCVLSIKTPQHLHCWLKKTFDIKKHQAALFMKFKSGTYSCLLMDLVDIPFKNVFDPSTGKAFIRYELEQTGNPGMRIE